VLAVGAFMAMLDSSIVVISLPSIARYFGVGLNGTVEWIVIAYLIVLAATMLTIGRLTDMFGHKPIWMSGAVIFILGSALCGMAPTLGALVAFRAFEGIGGALLIAVGPAMLTSAFPSSERGRALGLYNVIMFVGVVVGPILGGLILQVAVWRVIFFINFPLGALGFMVASRVLHRTHTHRQGSFDPIGALLLGIGLACVTLGLSFGQEWGWRSSRVLAALLIGGASLLATVITELHVSQPVLDLSLFRVRAFTFSTVALIMSFLALFAVSFLLPFYLEELHGYSTIRTGFLLTPMPLSVAAISPLSGWMADRAGTRWLQVVGMAVAAAGLVLVSEFSAITPLWEILAALVMTGLGRGLFLSPNSSALLGAAPAERQGIAAGLLATGETSGQCLSVALIGAIFVGVGGAAAGSRLGSVVQGAAALPGSTVFELRHTFTHSFHLALLACAAFAALGALTSLVPEKRRVLPDLAISRISDVPAHTVDPLSAAAAGFADRPETGRT